MRRILYAFLFLLPLCATAGPGDTTFTQAHFDKHLTYYNNYDTAVTFPSGSVSYRRVVMTFTLGKYACPGYNPSNAGDGPGQTGWCGDWDYTVHTFLMTPAGDTVELGRLITPYARQTSPRTPLTWKQRYTFDVTDYAPLLKNGATIRIKYSGYSGGFTANVRFAFIEGTPVRNVTGVKKLWNGDYSYGHGTPIDTRIAAVSLTPPAGTQASEMKFIITGHGADGQGCAEFCSKNYTVLQNAAVVATRAIWRADCGSNHLYPQSGTWVYDRGNWCPGDQVAVHSYALPSTSASTVDVNFDAHTSTGSNLASYSVFGSAIHFGAFNKPLDASIDDVISPSNHEQHFRQNPTCNTPLIRVSNGGSTTLTSIKFEYGVNGGPTTQHTWNGSLGPLRNTIVSLPRLPEFRQLTGAANTFLVRVLQANNATDADITNNTFTTTFAAMPVWDTALRIQLRSNLMPGETSYRIYAADGSVVHTETAPAASTTYTDTVRLQPGCYRMEVEDAGCDGLQWWANGAQGSGFLTVSKLGGAGYTLGGYFARDFGCGFTQYFSVTGQEPTLVEAVSGGKASLVVAPNPAATELHLYLDGAVSTRGRITVLNAIGQQVYNAPTATGEVLLDVSRWPAGLYRVTFTDAEGRGRLHASVVVAH